MKQTFIFGSFWRQGSFFEKLKKGYFFFFLSLILTSCSNDDGTDLQQITISLKTNQRPSMMSSEFKLGQSSFSTSWGLSLPSSLADVNCVGIFVRIPEIAPNGKCTNTNNTILFEPNKAFGTMPVNGSMSIAIPKGPAREFYLIGFNSNIGCFDINSDIDAFAPSISPPLYIPVTGGVIDITDATTAINLTGTIASGEEISDCDGSIFGDGINGGGGASGGSFVDPCTTSSISYCNIWLDATDASTLGQTACHASDVGADNDPIGCWANKGNTGVHAQQATAGYRPTYLSSGLNSYPTVKFDGTQQYLKSAGEIGINESFTMIIVYQATTAGLGTAVGSTETAPSKILIGQNASGNIGAIGGTVDFMTNDTTLSVTSTARIVSFVVHSGSSAATSSTRLYVDGNTTSIAESAKAGDLCATLPCTLVFGAEGSDNTASSVANYFDGNISEFLLYDYELADSAREEVEQYLKGKWSL